MFRNTKDELGKQKVSSTSAACEVFFYNGNISKYLLYRAFLVGLELFGFLYKFVRKFFNGETA
jgi:hypothetical protein